MLKCTTCKGTKFKQVGNSVYCVNMVTCLDSLALRSRSPARRDGNLCGARLNKAQRKKYFAREKKKTNRKLYFNNYYHSKRKKFREAALICEVALIKFCTERCVRKNIHRFDIIKGSSPLLVVLNEKVYDWKIRGYLKRR